MLTFLVRVTHVCYVIPFPKPKLTPTTPSPLDITPNLLTSHYGSLHPNKLLSEPFSSIFTSRKAVQLWDMEIGFAQPLRSVYLIFSLWLYNDVSFFERGIISPQLFSWRSLQRDKPRSALLRQVGATVAEWLARSPPTMASRIQSPGRVTGFSQGGIWQVEAVDRRVFSGIPFPPPLHSGAAPYSPSSALKTSLLRAAQNSSLITSTALSECKLLKSTGWIGHYRKLAQSSPSTVTADNQCAVDIGIFEYKTVESTQQVIELNISFRTWTCLEDRNAHIAICNLHVDTRVTDIAESLNAHNIKHSKLSEWKAEANFLSFSLCFSSPSKNKIGVKHMYAEVDFLMRSQFIRHTLDDSGPIADLQGNKYHKTWLTPHLQLNIPGDVYAIGQVAKEPPVEVPQSSFAPAHFIAANFLTYYMFFLIYTVYIPLRGGFSETTLQQLARLDTHLILIDFQIYLTSAPHTPETLDNAVSSFNKTILYTADTAILRHQPRRSGYPFLTYLHSLIHKLDRARGHWGLGLWTLWTRPPSWMKSRGAIFSHSFAQKSAKITVNNYKTVQISYKENVFRTLKVLFAHRGGEFSSQRLPLWHSGRLSLGAPNHVFCPMESVDFALTHSVWRGRLHPKAPCQPQKSSLATLAVAKNFNANHKAAQVVDWPVAGKVQNKSRAEREREREREGERERAIFVRAPDQPSHTLSITRGFQVFASYDLTVGAAQCPGRKDLLRNRNHQPSLAAADPSCTESSVQPDVITRCVLTVLKPVHLYRNFQVVISVTSMYLQSYSAFNLHSRNEDSMLVVTDNHTLYQTLNVWHYRQSYTALEVLLYLQPTLSPSVLVASLYLPLLGSRGPACTHSIRVPDDAGFLGDLQFSQTLQSGAAPYRPLFTLIGSRHFVVKLRQSEVNFSYMEVLYRPEVATWWGPQVNPVIRSQHIAAVTRDRERCRRVSHSHVKCRASISEIKLLYTREFHGDTGRVSLQTPCSKSDADRLVVHCLPQMILALPKVQEPTIAIIHTSVNFMTTCNVLVRTYPVAVAGGMSCDWRRMHQSMERALFKIVQPKDKLAPPVVQLLQSEARELPEQSEVIAVVDEVYSPPMVNKSQGQRRTNTHRNIQKYTAHQWLTNRRANDEQILTERYRSMQPTNNGKIAKLWLYRDEDRWGGDGADTHNTSPQEVGDPSPDNCYNGSSSWEFVMGQAVTRHLSTGEGPNWKLGHMWDVEMVTQLLEDLTNCFGTHPREGEGWKRTCNSSLRGVPGNNRRLQLPSKAAGGREKVHRQGTLTFYMHSPSPSPQLHSLPAPDLPTPRQSSVTKQTNRRRCKPIYAAALNPQIAVYFHLPTLQHLTSRCNTPGWQLTTRRCLPDHTLTSPTHCGCGRGDTIAITVTFTHAPEVHLHQWLGKRGMTNCIAAIFDKLALTSTGATCWELVQSSRTQPMKHAQSGVCCTAVMVPASRYAIDNIGIGPSFVFNLQRVLRLIKKLRPMSLKLFCLSLTSLIIYVQALNCPKRTSSNASECNRGPSITTLREFLEAAYFIVNCPYYKNGNLDFTASRHVPSSRHVTTPQPRGGGSTYEIASSSSVRLRCITITPLESSTALWGITAPTNAQQGNDISTPPRQTYEGSRHPCVTSERPTSLEAGSASPFTLLRIYKLYEVKQVLALISRVVASIFQRVLDGQQPPTALEIPTATRGSPPLQRPPAPEAFRRRRHQQVLPTPPSSTFPFSLVKLPQEELHLFTTEQNNGDVYTMPVSPIAVRPG
ncbi:hypothetical protein PR048_033111 [Dryococelus australis]|uniref:Uncharacterized protein n=1 Tax=Dryococelus australis TaxID=614101 RepID=A0ABQ9G3J3_9NEOP|nr:hypothetical protein PR048_033111 [Dryococelus australis]